MVLLSTLWAENIVSRPVGVVRISIDPESDELLSIPFDAFDPSLDAVLGGQLTGAPSEELADRVLKWDQVSQEYISAFLAGGTGDAEKDGRWFADDVDWEPTSLTVEPGGAFWIENRQSETQVVYLCGQVVLDDVSSVMLGSTLNLFGYPFSSAIALNDTTFAEDGALAGTSPEDADAITEAKETRRFWLLDDPTSQHHGKWLDENNLLANEILSPGCGYWYDRLSAEPLEWIEERPYAHGFPTNDALPSITALVADTGTGRVTLAISTCGTPGELLEVYYKDFAPTNSLETHTSWLIAATGLAPAGQSNMLWADVGSQTRVKPGIALGRLYLIGRGDIDTDKDGVPDARELFVDGTDPTVNEWLTELSFWPDASLGDIQPVSTNTTSSVVDSNILENASSNTTPPSVHQGLSRIIYVDQRLGNDGYSGRMATTEGFHGPKKTIHAGLKAARSGDTVLIMSGVYEEDLAVAGRDITVRVVGDVNLSSSPGGSTALPPPDGVITNR